MEVLDLEAEVADLREQYLKLVDVGADYEKQISAVMRKITNQQNFAKAKSKREEKIQEAELTLPNEIENPCQVLESALVLCKGDQILYEAEYTKAMKRARAAKRDVTRIEMIRSGEIVVDKDGIQTA